MVAGLVGVGIGGGFGRSATAARVHFTYPCVAGFTQPLREIILQLLDDGSGRSHIVILGSLFIRIRARARAGARRVLSGSRKLLKILLCH
ncbi:hypothetical protein Mapa_005905 [Marchantia paleacea]|nr:hypothetical protein Mapa_005905 [Marchantia paleacea]